MADEIKQPEEIVPQYGPLLPWEDLIICKEVSDEKTAHGVYLPSADQLDNPDKQPEKGIVVSVGKLSDLKKKLPVAIEPGDMIFYERYTANKIPDGTEIRNFIRLKFVVGVKKLVKEKK